MEKSASIFEKNLNLKATELRLGLPGREDDEAENQPFSCLKNINKRPSSQMDHSTRKEDHGKKKEFVAPPPKAQMVGWPPVRSYRKNVMKKTEPGTDGSSSGMFVKVSMDGAPYLRKIDLKFYKNYSDLLKALESMFNCAIGVYSEREGYNGSEFVPTYEDKDGDWMLVGDVPWDMYISSCKKLRIMKGSEAKGLGCL